MGDPSTRTLSSSERFAGTAMFAAAVAAGLAFALPLGSVRDPDLGTVDLHAFTGTTSGVTLGIVLLLLACIGVGVSILIVGSTWGSRAAAAVVAGSLLLTLTTFVGSLDSRLVEVPCQGSGAFCGAGTIELSGHFKSGSGVYAIAAALVAAIVASGLLLLPRRQRTSAADTVLRRKLVKAAEWYRGHGLPGTSAMASASWVSVVVGWILLAVAVPLAVILRTCVATIDEGGFLGPIHVYPAWAVWFNLAFIEVPMLLFATSLPAIVLAALIGRRRHVAETRHHSAWRIGIAAGIGLLAAFVPIGIEWY